MKQPVSICAYLVWFFVSHSFQSSLSRVHLSMLCYIFAPVGTLSVSYRRLSFFRVTGWFQPGFVIGCRRASSCTSCPPSGKHMFVIGKQFTTARFANVKRVNLLLTGCRVCLSDSLTLSCWLTKLNFVQFEVVGFLSKKGAFCLS